MEQYGRRLCLRIDDVPTVNSKSSDDASKSVKSQFRETKMGFPKAVEHCAHRTGPNYLDKILNKTCKRIIARFTTFQHRTMFYRAKKKLKERVKVKLDLTKSRFALLKKANNHVKEVPTIKLCYADVNCCVKVKFNNESQKDQFFSSFHDLCDTVDIEV